MGGDSRSGHQFRSFSPTAGGGGGGRAKGAAGWSLTPARGASGVGSSAPGLSGSPRTVGRYRVYLARVDYRLSVL